MPYRLSNVSWATFLREVNPRALDLPPWGGIVEWMDRPILVYIGPPTERIPQGEIFLTDISAYRADFEANFLRQYDPGQEVWFYRIPEGFMQVLAERAADVGVLLDESGNIVVKIAEKIGEAAGGLTKPLLENLTVPLVVAGVIGIVLLAKR